MHKVIPITKAQKIHYYEKRIKELEKMYEDGGDGEYATAISLGKTINAFKKELKKLNSNSVTIKY